MSHVMYITDNAMNSLLQELSKEENHNFSMCRGANGDIRIVDFNDNFSYGYEDTLDIVVSKFKVEDKALLDLSIDLSVDEEPLAGHIEMYRDMCRKVYILIWDDYSSI